MIRYQDLSRLTPRYLIRQSNCSHLSVWLKRPTEYLSFRWGVKKNTVSTFLSSTPGTPPKPNPVSIQYNLPRSRSHDKPHAPPHIRVSPDLTSWIASSAESHSFFVFGTGKSKGRLYCLTDAHVNWTRMADLNARAASILSRQAISRSRDLRFRSPL